VADADSDSDADADAAKETKDRGDDLRDVDTKADVARGRATARANIMTKVLVMEDEFQLRIEIFDEKAYL
jgi:hypothetical protein